MYCGNEECLTSYSIWTKRHQYALQDIQVPLNCLPDSVWDARIQNKQCLLCGGTGCLEPLSKAVKSHPKLQLEMEVQQKKYPTYLLNRDRPVKSGERSIVVSQKDYMNSVQSASCIGLAFASDSMCFNCRNICSEPAVRIALKREIQCSEDSLKTFQPARQNVIQSVKKYGIYCVENHSGRDIILGTAEIYREGKLKESAYYHKVQHLMIQA